MIYRIESFVFGKRLFFVFEISRFARNDTVLSVWVGRWVGEADSPPHVRHWCRHFERSEKSQMLLDLNFIYFTPRRDEVKVSVAFTLW